VSLCVDWREMRLAQRALLQSSGPVVIGPDGRVDVVATEIARAT